MTYRKRYEALGFNASSWARRCRVARSTVFRHHKMEERGDIGDIPGPFFVILELLEAQLITTDKDKT